MIAALRSRLRRPSGEGLVALLLVAGAVVFTLAQLYPSLVLRNTLANGGDMGAHVWGPDYLRNHLLTQGRLSGWSPDWYAGFPAYVFYMVVPSLVVVAVSLLVPYAVAFKVVTLLGVATLPVACWFLGRCARLPFPGPPLLAIGAVGFLFERSYTIYGGNILSTLAGEFAFSLSLTVAVVFLAVVLRGLDTGRRRALAAGLFALTLLCHVIPAFFAAGAAVVVWLSEGRRTRLRWFVSMGAVGALLTGFWTVPFVIRRAYATDMGWNKTTTYLESLLPGSLGEWLSSTAGGAASANVSGDITLVAVLAVLGVVFSLLFNRRLGVFLALVAMVTACAFVLAPEGRLWNARLLPFWCLSLYLLAAMAVAEVARAGAELLSPDPEQPNRVVRLLAPVALAAVGLVLVAFPLRTLPFGQTVVDRATGVTAYSWLGFSSSSPQSIVRSWARWNYTGYQGQSSWPEYDAAMQTMTDVGADHGCGRAMWEYSSDQNRYGTTMAMMLLPYWTDGCIGSMEAVYFESSATTPYHFLNQSELSTAPSRAQSGLPYGGFNVADGVTHLQLLGVRYYMTYTDAAAAAADQEGRLSLLATSGPWRVYAVADAELVTALANEPAVVRDAPSGGEAWQDLSVEWYQDADEGGLSGPDEQVLLAASGPSSWQRVDEGETPDTRTTGEATTVTNIRSGDDSVSFDVDQVGTPVLVKVSYFPNWTASGADGPYRVTPNLMVVVPTSTHVELSYATTPVDLLGWTATVVGAGALVPMVLRRPRRPEPPAFPLIEGELLAVTAQPWPTISWDGGDAVRPAPADDVAADDQPARAP